MFDATAAPDRDPERKRIDGPSLHLRSKPGLLFEK